MPYYIGEGMPEWDELIEAESPKPPRASKFKYIEPWQAKTAVLPFPDTPGPEPEPPQPVAYSQTSFLENYRKMQSAASAHALWRVSGMTAAFRAQGVKRVFGSYNGGGDEGFTHVTGIETRNSKVIPEESIPDGARRFECDELVENSVIALMASFDAGEFVLRGAVTIDLDACTITDEKNRDVSSAARSPGRFEHGPSLASRGPIGEAVRRQGRRLPRDP